MAATLTSDDVKRFLIEALHLEDLRPEDLDEDTPLFEGGLALDSIDKLELGMALRKRFGIVLDAEVSLQHRLGTLRALREFLAGWPTAT